MILLTPGPVQVKKEVFNIITKHNIFHRSSIFENIFKKCLEKIKIIFNADGSYTAPILAGPGTMAIESFVQSIISKNQIFLLSQTDILAIDSKKLSKVVMLVNVCILLNLAMAILYL
jgi:aspartate aminotransferase-like enzyme